MLARGVLRLGMLSLAVLGLRLLRLGLTLAAAPAAGRKQEPGAHKRKDRQGSSVPHVDDSLVSVSVSRQVGRAGVSNREGPRLGAPLSRHEITNARPLITSATRAMKNIA